MQKHDERERKPRHGRVFAALLPIIAFSMILIGFVIVFGFLLAGAG